MKSGGSLIVAGLLIATAANAEDRVSLGVGVGATYAGLGANVAWATERAFSYFAMGCVGRYEGDGGSGNACGVGAGGMWTNVLGVESRNHAFGFYVGPVSWRRPDVNSIDTIYGAGPSYAYFFSGIDQPGFQAGVTPALGRDNGETNGYLLLNVGYQF